MMRYQMENPQANCQTSQGEGLQVVSWPAPPPIGVGGANQDGAGQEEGHAVGQSTPLDEINI